ncbi:MAG: SlyX family protein [Moraxellaceae bacterium]|nr:SlyX family protein [Moraxellaceae bacterium]
METRLNDLEARVAFQDDLLESLNNIVARQQQQIDLLQRESRLLYEQMKSLSASVIPADGEEPPPPHY